MEFLKKAPEWKAPGVAPPPELVEAGYLPGYKPPAAYINWQFHSSYESILELQETLKDYAKLNDTEKKALATELAKKLNSAEFTAEKIIALLNGGTGGGLNADTVDGKHAGDLADRVHGHAQSEITGLVAALGDLNRSVAGKAPLSHVHNQSEVTGLSDALSEKAAAIHTHEQAQVTGLLPALQGKADKVHGHAQGEVAGLEGALQGKAEKVHSHGQGEVTGLEAALQGKAEKVHGHGQGEVTGLEAALQGKADLVGGKVNPAQLPSLNYDPAGSAAGVQSSLNAHAGDGVKHVTAGERTAWNGKLDASQKGQANGVAPLGADGKVPAGYLGVQGGGEGGLVAQSTPPTNTKLGWIDTSTGGVLKYYSGTAWVAVAAAWG